jgi:hypothetical protein
MQSSASGPWEARTNLDTAALRRSRDVRRAPVCTDARLRKGERVIIQKIGAVG